MPLRAELAPAADIREHVDAAALQPGRAERGRVRRCIGDLEAAIRGQQRRIRAVVPQALTADDEEWDLRAVLRRGLELVDFHAARVPHHRQSLHFLRGALLVHEEQGRRLNERGVGEEVAIRVGRGGAGSDRSHPGALTFSNVHSPLSMISPKLALHVVEDVHEHEVAGDAHAVDALARAGLGDETELFLAGEKVVHRRCDERARVPFPATDVPRGSARTPAGDGGADTCLHRSGRRS